MPSSTATLNNVSEQLFHIKRTITDLSPDLSNSAHIVDILGTYTDLAAAKKAARRALFSEGYLANDFEIYEENNGDENWKYGDGVKAYAKAFAGQVFEVRIDTKPNTAGLKSEGEEEFEGELFYVLETIIDYNGDRIGGVQTTEVEGTYLTQSAALAAAKTALIDDDGITKESFVEYDEKDDARDVDEWPYGDDVYVHAVSGTGENFLVSVKGRKMRFPAKRV